MFETLANQTSTLLPAGGSLLASWWDRLWYRGLKDNSTFASEVDAVFMFIFWVSMAFFVLLMFLMVYWAIKYRRVPGTHAQPSPSHNTRLELAWTIIPTILLAIMFFWGFKAYIGMTIAPVDAEQIQVTAQQWAWQWEYDNGAGTLMSERIADAEAPVFALPTGRPVKFVMSSQDVIHSMYIPAFRAKRDVFPNRYTTMWVEATSATHRAVGEGDSLSFEPIEDGMKGYYLACTEYCGDQHSQMWARVITLEDADYRKWKNAQASTESIPLIELGKLLHTAKGCVACHTVDGSTGTGPSWKGIWGKTHEFEDGTSGVVDENYIRESILVPDARIVQGYPNQMVSYQGRLTDREIRAITVYIQSLSEKPADQEAAKQESEQEMQAQDAAGEGGEGGAS